MYPGTIINPWHDQSAISTRTIEQVDNIPLYAHVSSFDRGPEDLRVVSGQLFYDLYGSKMNFSKHGQPALQAANIIDGGGQLLLKRLVAKDALLANVIFVASVTSVTEATKDTESTATAVSLQYLTTGVDDPEAATKYNVVDTKASVKWTAVSVSNCKLHDEVMTEAEKLHVVSDATVVTAEDDSVTVTKTEAFPMIVATDNGRGVSSKAIRFSPDFNTSKDMGNMYFNVYVYEGTTRLDEEMCTLNPKSVYNNTLYGLNKDTSIQVNFEMPNGMYDAYIAKIVELTGLTEAELLKDDMIFITDNRGTALSAISLDAESIDLGATYGVELQNGSNGEFEDVPFGTQAWTDAAIEVFDGSFDDTIWDVDVYKIAAIFDANYPDALKTVICDFVNFRQDCVYFRDYGIDVNSYAAIDAKYNGFENKDRTNFIADYYTTYQIYDPETKIRERVTMMYDFARTCVVHFTKGAYRPLAGVVNDMILPSAIEGTINFTPRITPKVNQKSLLDDKRINYAIFVDGQCVVQSLYTSQIAYSQLSYANNVLAIQEVVRSVRNSCPKQRYTFTSGSDFSSYADAVNTVLKGFRGNFAELIFEYQQNDLKASQKIFYATISFRFNNWAQTEVFDLFALGDAE